MFQAPLCWSLSSLHIPEIQRGSLENPSQTLSLLLRDPQGSLTPRNPLTPSHIPLLLSHSGLLSGPGMGKAGGWTGLSYLPRAESSSVRPGPLLLRGHLPWAHRSARDASRAFRTHPCHGSYRQSTGLSRPCEGLGVSCHRPARWRGAGPASGQTHPFLCCGPCGTQKETWHVLAHGHSQTGGTLGCSR